MAAEVGQARSTESPLATCLLRVGATLVTLLMSSIWGTVDARSPNNCSLNLWPFLYYERNEESGREIGEFLWPFIYFESGPEGYDYGLRPLFSIRREEKTFSGKGNSSGLSAGIRARRRRGGCGFSLSTIIIKAYLLTARKRAIINSSLSFSGAGRKRRVTISLFFPLGGQLNRWLGRDRIRFFLFPLYADTTKGDYRSWYVLWPFLSYGRGEGERAYRFWPLFGHGYKVGEYSKSFILWPIFNFQRTGLDTENPSEVLMILPFYAYQRSPEKRTEAILWPFFTYTDNKRGGYKEWHLPWPIFSRTRGEDREGETSSGLSGDIRERGRENVSMPFLAYRREGREKIRLSFLKGLLEYEREGSEKT